MGQIENNKHFGGQCEISRLDAFRSVFHIKVFGGLTHSAKTLQTVRVSPTLSGDARWRNTTTTTITTTGLTACPSPHAALQCRPPPFLPGPPTRVMVFLPPPLPRPRRRPAPSPPSPRLRGRPSLTLFHLSYCCCSPSDLSTRSFPSSAPLLPPSRFFPFPSSYPSSPSSLPSLSLCKIAPLSP